LYTKYESSRPSWERTEEALPNQTPIPAKEFSVLLVESDDRDAAHLGRAFAEIGLGSGLQRAKTLESAIDHLSGKGAAPGLLPSLILVSLTLSRASDFKLLRWLKGRPDLRKVPVVVLANSRQPPGFDRAVDLGAVSYLVKPVDRDALRSMATAVVQFWELDRRRDR
jgi:two-component system, response regulator